MNQRERAKLNMYEAIITLCEGNTALIATILALSNGYSEFKSTVGAIVSADTMLETSIAGVTVSKRTSKQNLARLGGLISGALSSYAVEIGDEVLEGEMKISESRIFHANGMRPVELCTLIYKRANTNIAALADYGITLGLLSAFNTAIGDFNGKEPLPKVSIDIKKGKRIEMKGMFKDADKLLKKKMDKLMINFKGTNATFYNAYIALRKPVKPAVFSTALKIQIVNSANDMPIMNAKVYEDGSAVAKNSSKKGFVTYKDLSDGYHYFKIKHPGFKNGKIEGVMIAYGEKKVLTVRLDTT